MELFIHSVMQSYGNIMANNLKDTNPKAGIGTKKVPLSSVPANVISEVAVALFEGNCKYGRHNYRETGARASVYYDSTWRHLSAWWEGQDIDPASGIHHITKAISGLMVLRDCMLRGSVTDDRPPASEEYEPELNALVESILERYGHINPKHVTNQNFEDKFNALHK